jgi:hypothetical protein
MKYIIIITCVLGHQVLMAQYAFNRTYQESYYSQQASSNIVVLQDSTYLIPGLGLIPDSLKYYWRRIDQNGDVISLSPLISSHFMMYLGNQEAFIPTPDSCYLQTSTYQNAVLNKFDSSGNLLWSLVIDSLNNASLPPIVLANNHYLFTGYEYLNPSSTLVWASTEGIAYRTRDIQPFDSTRASFFQQPYEFFNGDLLLGGVILRNNIILYDGLGEPFNADNTDMAMIRTDSVGEVLWARNWHEEIRDGFLYYEVNEEELTATTYQTHVLSYDSLSADHYPFQAVMGSMEIDLDTGDSSGVMYYYADTLDSPFIYDMVRTPDSGYAFLGQANYAGPPWTYGFIMKLDADRNFEWLKEYTYNTEDPNNSANHVVKDIDVTLDGGFIVAGTYVDWNTLDTTYQFPWVFKTNACGELEWTADCTPISVIEQEIGVESFRCYPNPAADQLTVELPLNHSAKQLSIMDAQGKVCMTSRIFASQKRMEFDLSDIATGLYFVKLFYEDGRQEAQRVMVVRN